MKPNQSVSQFSAENPKKAVNGDMRRAVLRSSSVSDTRKVQENPYVTMLASKISKTSDKFKSIQNKYYASSGGRPLTPTQERPKK